MDKETEVWFAMRATYRRELEAMHLLEKANLGCFIPMQYKISIRRVSSLRAFSKSSSCVWMYIFCVVFKSAQPPMLCSVFFDTPAR